MNGRRDRLVQVMLDERTVVRRRPEVEHERAIAIYDLLEENVFELLEFAEHGPYQLAISIEDNRLGLNIQAEDGAHLSKVMLPLSGLRSIVRDYFMVCENYYAAIKKSSPSQIEAIDMGRRALHNEGSEMLRERLADRIRIDHDTARRLFTLVCVLHIRG